MSDIIEQNIRPYDPEICINILQTAKILDTDDILHIISVINLRGDDLQKNIMRELLKEFGWESESNDTLRIPNDEQ